MDRPASVEINGVSIAREDVKADAALAAWQRHRRETPTTGLYPLIVVEDLIELLLRVGPDPTPSTIRVDAANWLRQRRSEMDPQIEETKEMGQDLVGAFSKDADPRSKLFLPFDILSGKPREDLSVLLIPGKSGAEAIELLGWGGWNECPEAEVHGALLRRWSERWGADLVTLGTDVLECVVNRPPQAPEQCMEIAWEQFLYCEDIVSQGCQSVGSLAGAIQNNPFWFFWWD